MLFANPFIVLDLDDPYEQKKLRKGSSRKLNDFEVQQRYDQLEERLKDVEDKNTLKGVNLDELNLVSKLVIPPDFKIPKLEKDRKSVV